MRIEYYDEEFDIPDILIDKYIKDFDGLPGSGMHESVVQLRESIHEILDVVAEEPDILGEPEYLHDFIRALAMKKALEHHGVMYDA